MWTELATYALRAPSPHNTQPVRLRIVDDTRAELWFVAARGLPVGDPRGRFTHVTYGIFEESLRIAAHARGAALEATYTGAPPYRDGQPEQKVADLVLRPAPAPVTDLDPDLMRRRRTNRHPYDARPVPDGVTAELRDEARRHGHAFDVTSDEAAVRWVKEVNADALYRDLEQADYRRELASWLRYSASEARRRRDGLSAGALALPGWLLRATMHTHRLMSVPGVRPITRRAYLRTMTGIPTVGWLRGDFVDPDDWTRAGRLMLRLWLILTRHGVDWQPYGSVITDEATRRRLVDHVGIEEGGGGRDMVWLLVRLGYSTHTPVASHRLPMAEVVR